MSRPGESIDEPVSVRVIAGSRHHPRPAVQQALATPDGGHRTGIGATVVGCFLIVLVVANLAVVLPGRSTARVRPA